MSLLMGIMDIELQIYFSDILSVYRANAHSSHSIGVVVRDWPGLVSV